MKKTFLLASLLTAGFYANAQTATTISGTDEAGWSINTTEISSAKFDFPYAAIFDSKGNMWVTDENNNLVILLQTSNSQYFMRSGGDGGYKDGIGYAIGQGGQGSYGAMSYPKGIVAGAGDTLYIVDNGNSAIRRLTPLSGNPNQSSSRQTLKTIAGGGNSFGENGESGYTEGKGLSARFQEPVGIAISNDKTYLLVADKGNNVIRKVMITGDYGRVTTFAGTGEVGDKDTIASQATFGSPEGIFIDANNDVYIAESFGRIRRIRNGMVETIVAEGNLMFPTSVVKVGSDLYIADGCNIQKYNMNTKTLSLYMGKSNDDTTACGFADGSRSTAQFNIVNSLTVSPDKSYLLVADGMNNRIRKVTIVSTVGVENTNMISSGLTVYPNPANKFITVEANLNMVQNAVVSLYDIAGRKVQEENVNFTQNTYRVDVSAQKSGFYILQINANGNNYSQRIVINH